MTVAEARELFKGHLKFGDPMSMEAHRILLDVEAVKDLLRKRGEFVKSRPKPGSTLATKLLLYSADVAETAFREFGIKEEEKKEPVMVPAAEPRKKQDEIAECEEPR
jgi:hypothetical protein